VFHCKLASPFSISQRDETHTVGSATGAESDGQWVIACCCSVLSSIVRLDRHIPRKHTVLSAMARVVPFLNRSAPVARKGQEAKHEAS